LKHAGLLLNYYKLIHSNFKIAYGDILY